MAAVSVLMILSSALFTQLSAHGRPEMIYYVAAATIAIASFVLIPRPFANLSLSLVYLISPCPMVLDQTHSAMVTTLLIANCLAGCLWARSFRDHFNWRSARIPILLSAVGVLGACYGLVHGNRVSFAIGDLYQVIEFSVLFFLGWMLVGTEGQFRQLANVILCAIVLTCVLQASDAVIGAEYLPRMGIKNWHRTINMNAPIAFVGLTALFASPGRKKKWILSGIGIIAINLVWSFTRGLWMATVISVIFLLLLQKGESRRAVLKFVFALSMIVIPLLYSFGLGSAIEDRVSYTAKQFGNPTEDDQNLSERRFLEYVLILPKIAERPLLGHGLGATFEISGSAIIEGPKDVTVDFHYIHDLYLLIAFRLGVVMLTVALVALWAYFRTAIRNLRTSNLSADGSLLLQGFIAAIFGEVVLSVTSPTILNHPTAGLLGCMMAITLKTLDPDFQPTT